MSTTASSPSHETIEEWELIAMDKEKHGDIKGALKIYRAEIKKNPEDLELKYKYAFCCVRAKKVSKAVDLLYEILQEDNKYLEAMDLLGKLLLFKGCQCGSKGWFTVFEAAQLYMVVRSIENPAPVIVELGSCFGLSSMIIATALSDRPNAKIYCVDAWEGDGSSVFGDTREFIKSEAESGREFFDLFKKNMTNAGVLDQLTPVQGYTTEVVKTWDQQADLIFVDADHSYEGVRSDVRDWKGHVKVSGHILMHDVDLIEAGSEKDSGPGMVVKEYLGAESNFNAGDLVDTLYYAERIA